MGAILCLGSIIYFLVKIVKAWYRHDIKGNIDGRWNKI